jgi:hypothetical protein
MRQAVAAGHSLNDTTALARRLGMTEPHTLDALNALVTRGEVGWTKAKTRKIGTGKNRRTITVKEGAFRRIARPANRGPQDILRFIARGGGIRPSGITEKEELLKYRGHDLRNTGHMDAFVPGGGKLLRENGKSLEQWGEALHEAGYFGPPEHTARPTEAELISFLDDTIHSGRKVYPYGEHGPKEAAIANARGVPEGYQDAEHYEHDRGLWQQSGERVIGRDLTDEEFAAAKRIEQKGIDEPFRSEAAHDFSAQERGEHYDDFVRTMVNHDALDAIDEAFYEHEDEHYETVEHQFRDARAESDARAAGPGDGRQEADAGNAEPRGERGEADARNDRPPEITPAQRDELDAAGIGTPPVLDREHYEKFDDPAGEGVQQAADSAWHDIKARDEYRKAFVAPKTGEEAAQLLWDEGASPERVAEFARGWEAGRHGTGKPANEDSDEYEGWFIGNRAREWAGEGSITIARAKSTEPALDRGAEVDPAIAERARQEAQLQADQPLRGARKTGEAQTETMPEGLFGGAEEPKFDIEDGKGARTAQEIAAELDAEQSGIDAIKGCMT